MNNFELKIDFENIARKSLSKTSVIKVEKISVLSPTNDILAVDQSKNGKNSTEGENKQIEKQ